MSNAYDPVEEDEFGPEGEPPPEGDDGFELEGEFDEGAPEGGPVGDEGLSVEDRARLQGWRPLEEFQGNPRMWRSAEEFLRRGDMSPGALHERNEMLLRRNARLEKQLGEANSSIANIQAQVTELLQRDDRRDEATRTERRADLSRRQREAVENGDTSAYDRIELEMRDLDKRPTQPAPPAAQPTFHPAITEFVEVNPWWKTDPKLQRAMNAHFGIIQDTRRDLDIEDQLALAKSRLVADFPDQFGEPPVPLRRPPPAPANGHVRRPAASSVARPTGNAGVPLRPGNRQPNGWDTIVDPKERAEARQAFESQKRADPGLTEREYLAVYHDPKIDALELRRQRKPA